MAEELEGLDKLHAAMREPIRKYADVIRNLAGSNALALTLFGAIAAGSFDPARHTARSVVVYQHVDLEMLRRLAQQGTKLGKGRIAAPLTMTPEYIQASVDTFPLEFLEIQQCHVCIFGQDYFEPLAFQDFHVRLQCERELKTILIAMRQGLLAAGGKEKLVATIDSDVSERLVRTLRGLLWLHGQKEPKPSVAVVDEVERAINRPLSGVRHALDQNEHHGWDEFLSLYDDTDALRKIVDAW